MHKSIFSSKHHINVNAIIIAIITFFICAISIAGNELDYPGNDDTFRNLISVGAFGDKYAYYITFSNVLYGIPIRLLNIAIPSINWYYWFMIGFSLISIISICILTFADKPYHISIFVTIILNLVLARDYYYSIQFTKVGYLWVICGFILLGTGLIRQKKYWILGLVLALNGFCSRKECLYLAIPFILLFLLFAFPWKKAELNASYIYKRLAIIFLSFAIFMTSEYIFCNNTEWGTFWDYNASRVFIHDHSNSEYEKFSEEYDSIGVSENDYYLFMSWQFGDTDYYTKELLDNMGEIIKSHDSTAIQLNIPIIKSTIINLCTIHKRTPIPSWIIPIFALTLILSMIILGKKQSKVYALLNLLGIIGCYWYFTCTNRFMWRAEIGCWIIVTFCMLSYIAFKYNFHSERKITRMILIGLSAIILSCYTFLMAYNYRYVKDGNIVNHEADITGLLDTLNADAGNFYFLTDFYVTNNPISITSSRYNHKYSNCCYMGNWVIPSPHGLYYLNQYGMTNPMRSLIEYDNTFLVTNSEAIVDHIKNHLSKVYNTEVTVTQTSDGIWKFMRQP